MESQGTGLAVRDPKTEAAVTIYSSAAAILRPAEARMPELGRIRAGMKILKKGCSDKDRAIYAKGLAEGKRWDEIEAELGPDAQNKTKLIPTNVGHFYLRKGDCVNPQHVEALTELAEKDDKGRPVAFPVVFYSDNWWDIVQHDYVCWGAQTVKYRSQLNVSVEGTQITGVERICVKPPDPEIGKRPCGIHREWPVRGACKPAECPEYQRKQCNLEGTIRCYIPGLKGHGLWQIKTHSYYSLEQITRTLLDVAAITHGRLRLLSHNGKSVFMLRKVQREVVQIDPQDGLPKKRKQWLLILETAIDEFDLAMAFEERAMLARGAAAAARLTPGNGSAARQPAAKPGEPLQIADPAEEEAEGDQEEEEPGAEVEAEIIEGAPAATAQKAEGSKAPETKKEPTSGDLIAEILVMKDGIPQGEYDEFRKTHRVTSNSTVEELRMYLDALRALKEKVGQLL